jgi:hypothetical protein
MMAALSSFGGRMLRAVFRGMLLLRRPRPIHPRGVVLRGTVRWIPGSARSGIDWIDLPPPGGEQAVAARVSRSVGLPAPSPDIIGLALRLDTPGGPADLELASTGSRFPSRFWLAPQRSPSRARLTTLFPYRGTEGAVLVGARTIAPANLPIAIPELAAALTDAPWRLRLYHATPRGRWHAFATVDLTHPAGRPIDGDLRFDAARHLLPGAAAYEWSLRLREPSYRLVQGEGPGASR